MERLLVGMEAGKGYRSRGGRPPAATGSSCLRSIDARLYGGIRDRPALRLLLLVDLVEGDGRGERVDLRVRRLARGGEVGVLLDPLLVGLGDVIGGIDGEH